MDTAPAIFNGDYGADHPDLGKAYLQDWANANVYVPTLRLARLMSVSLAMGHKESGTLNVEAHKRLDCQNN